MRYVVRPGQKTWHGRTKQQVLEAASFYDREARETNVAEVAHRARDRAAFYRKQAGRMT